MKENFIITILANGRPLVFTLTATTEQLNYFQMGARSALDAIGATVQGIYFEKKGGQPDGCKVIDLNEKPV